MAHGEFIGSQTVAGQAMSLFIFTKEGTMWARHISSPAQFAILWIHQRVSPVENFTTHASETHYRFSRNCPRNWRSQSPAAHRLCARNLVAPHGCTRRPSQAPAACFHIFFLYYPRHYHLSGGRRRGQPVQPVGSFPIFVGCRLVPTIAAVHILDHGLYASRPPADAQRRLS